MGAVSLRQATSADAELIHRFILELARYEREPDSIVEATPGTLRAQLESERPPFECVLAHLDGAPAGFALFFHSYSTWKGKPGIYLEDLFVLEPARRNGVGRALLAHLATLCVERDCARLEWAVLDWNQPAIDFYKSLGAQPLDEWSTFRLTGEPLRRLGAE